MSPYIQYRLTELPKMFWNLISIQKLCMSLFNLIFKWLQLSGQDTNSKSCSFSYLEFSLNHNNIISHLSILAIYHSLKISYLAVSQSELPLLDCVHMK